MCSGQAWVERGEERRGEVAAVVRVLEKEMNSRGSLTSPKDRNRLRLRLRLRLHFQKYTHYNDLTEVCKERAISIVEIAEELKKCVYRETGLTCSAGVAPNRLLAKMMMDQLIRGPGFMPPPQARPPMALNLTDPSPNSSSKVRNRLITTLGYCVDKAVELRNELASRNPENGALASWSGDPCLPLQWEGLQCEPISYKSFIIDSIDVSSKGLNGSIPTVVAELTHLKYLWILIHGFSHVMQAIGAVFALATISIPTMNAFRRLATSMDKFSKVASEEVPGTLSSLKLSGLEINDLTQQLSKIRSIMNYLILNLLSAIRHENLVPLLGYCCENDQQILVYPFMSNGSLQDRLYGEASKGKF
ncbi:hypothetical protein Sjap_011519 [Stephania japonica]|uniref:UmuC domain-containing protein n=1 Tax=Stephania japonica TaxID=461633 RepID=A0AAP0P4S7_9MAGN